MKDYAAKRKTRQARYIEESSQHAQLNCMIDKDIYKRFKATAYANNLMIKDALPKALELFVRKHK